MRRGPLLLFQGKCHYNNTIVIEACTFTANNAISGAGLFVEFQDLAHDNDVMVFNSTPDSNICDIKYKSGGGGMRIAVIFYDKAEVNTTTFHSIPVISTKTAPTVYTVDCPYCQPENRLWYPQIH